MAALLTLNQAEGHVILVIHVFRGLGSGLAVFHP